MKATCPNCQTSYRVADEKVPAVGAQIECPKCGNQFVVKPAFGPGAGPASGEPAAGGAPAGGAQSTTPTAGGPGFGPGAGPASGEPVAGGAPAGGAQSTTPTAGGPQSTTPTAGKPAAGQAAPDSAVQPPPVARADEKPAAQPQAGLEQTTPLTDLASGTPTPGAGAGGVGGTGDGAPAGAGDGAPGAGERDGAPGAGERDGAPGAGGGDGASITPNLDRLEGEAEVSPGGGRPAGVSAIRAQSARKRDPTLSGFRVRTPQGLTYDFPSRPALDRWLAEREDVSGCQVAAPGGDWQPVEQVLAQRPNAAAADSAGGGPAAVDPSRPLDAGAMRPVVAVPPGAPVGAAAQPEPERDPYAALRPPRAGWLLWSALVVTALALLATGAVTVTRYGVLDLSAYLPLEIAGVRAPATAAAEPRAAADVPVQPEQADPEKRFRRALVQGRRDLRAKRFSRAALEFKRALGVHPGSVEALEGLAKAFAGLGDKQRATAALRKARQIKHR